MSRLITARYTITATLQASEPIHVGAAEAGLATDMLCARDGLDRFHIPGSSLAGALRAELRARGVEHRHLWGESDSGEAGEASRVCVADAPALGEPMTEIRDGVAIDPDSGTASHGLLYTREVLPAGTCFQVRVQLEESSEGDAKDDAMELAQVVAKLLATDGLTVGAFTTKGLGRLRAAPEGTEASVTLSKWDLATVTGLLDLLFAGPTDMGFDEVVLPGRVDEVTISIPWQARGPILVSRSVDGGQADTVPLTTGSAAGPRLCLPGSSIKGAMRAQGERIVATMGSGAAAVAALRDLFGAPGQVQHRDGRAHNTGQRGSLRVSDVRSVSALPPGTVLGVPGEAEQGSQSPLITQVDQITASGGPALAVGDHVAIDRWTGGARDTALYSVLEPWQSEPDHWEPIRLVAELASIPAHRRDAALGLLYLVCRDLVDGWFGIGFGTARGYGAVAASDPQIAGLPDGPTTLTGLLEAGQPKRWVAALWSEGEH